MKILKRTLLTGLGIMVLNASHAATQIIDLSTGVDASGSLLPVGTNNEDTWLMLLPGSTGFQWASVLANPTANCGRWIGPNSTVGGGNSIFRANFNTTVCSISSVQLIVSYTNADDLTSGFTINNGLFNYTYSTPQPGIATGYNPNTFYTINIPASSIVYGNNTIDFSLFNWTSAPNSPTPHKFRFCGYIEITYEDLIVTPSITGPSTFCQNGPFSFTGSDGPATASSHHWEFLECDAAGTPTNPANTWTSSTFNGSPGLYTFPTLSFVQCGQYYLVKLVVSDNCYTQSATKVIYITCPYVDAGPDKFLCNEGCVNIGTSETAGIGYEWTGMIDEPFYAGTGAVITVCPSYTTTYCLTATGSDGCSNTDCMTVYVEQLDPSFSCSLNTTNNSYFNLFATPNQLTNFPAGFNYSWIVEELDASLNPVWSVVNPACWWNFPSITTNNFGGVWGLTQVFSCSTIPGQFKYNTDYRITRGVWSNNCPWDQSSLLVSYAKSGNGAIIITEDRDAPDFSWTMNQEGPANANTVPVSALQNKLSLYPNPVNDVLHISYVLEENANGKLLLTDVSGKLIRVVQLGNANRAILDLGGYQDGIYFVHLYINERLSATEKIVINH